MNRIVLMVLRNLYRIPKYYGKLCHYAKYTDRYSDLEKWTHIHTMMRFAVESGNIDLEIYGAENIPAPDSPGFLMYGNHQGMFDVLAIAASCATPLAAVLKKELVDIPLLKQIRLCTHSYGMDRDDVRQSLTVIQNVTKDVQAGKHFLIFPEGTRSKNGNVMGDFHSGSFRCALKSKCPIIPFVLIDSFKVLDQKGSKPVAIQIHYLPAIPYEEYKDLKTVELAALVKARIQDTLDRYAGQDPEPKEA